MHKTDSQFMFKLNLKPGDQKKDENDSFYPLKNVIKYGINDCFLFICFNN